MRGKNSNPQGRKAAAARSEASANWIGAYASVWRKEMGGEPPFGQLAGFLKPLHELYGPEKVCRAFGIYLRDAGKYASVARFSQTVKLWLPTEQERWCVHHPNIGMYGVKEGKPLCMTCWNDAKGAA